MPKNITNAGSTYIKVQFSREEIAAFNLKHPDSLLRPERSYWFEFSVIDGDLVDCDVPQQDECDAAEELQKEAWRAYEDGELDEEEGQVDDTPLSAKDIREFNGYLRNCSDNQVRGCHEKEKAAGRDGYVALCEAEAARRGVSLD